ncbi:F0F1 ATP synthase subunit gamma [Leifsonia aquatica]|uniref:F0F1 ATP synthase subunit gamma n=1 Tax=Leifsonia aquatica TaxID=144185 RepID=UPI0037FF6A58
MSIRQLDDTIRSLTATASIVRTTELSTLAMLPGLRRSAEAATSYYDTVLASIEHIRGTDELRYRMAHHGSGTAVIVVTSDRGMCGPYNHGVFTLLEQYLGTLGSDARHGVQFISIGSKGREYLERRGERPAWSVDRGLEGITIGDTAIIAARIAAGLRAKDYSSIVAVSTRYLDAAHSKAQVLPLFPELPRTSRAASSASAAVIDFEDDPQIVVDRLIDSYLCGMVYAVIRYAVASEYSARQMAMHQAKNGIEEQLADAKRKRKKSITQRRTAELLDIVNGFNAQRRTR